MDFLVRALMDMQGNFKFELVWEVDDKLVDVVLILVEVILHSLFKTLV